MKKCVTCGVEKSPDEYYKNKNCRDGKDTRCKACSKAASYKSVYGDTPPQPRKRDLPRSERKAYLDSVRDVPCLDCGGRFPAVCMDFDHLRDKKFSIMSAYGRWPWKDVLAEIDKCEIVCANCHRIRTAERRPFVI